MAFKTYWGSCSVENSMIIEIVKVLMYQKSYRVYSIRALWELMWGAVCAACGWQLLVGLYLLPSKHFWYYFLQWVQHNLLPDSFQAQLLAENLQWKQLGLHLLYHLRRDPSAELACRRMGKSLPGGWEGWWTRAIEPYTPWEWGKRETGQQRVSSAKCSPFYY